MIIVAVGVMAKIKFSLHLYFLPVFWTVLHIFKLRSFHTQANDPQPPYKNSLNTLCPSYCGKWAGSFVRERGKKFPSNKLLLFWRGKLTTATILQTVYKLLKPLQTKKGRVYLQPTYRLCLSWMWCSWLPKWMNCTTLPIMLIWILFLLRSFGLKATFIIMLLHWRATISSAETKLWKLWPSYYEKSWLCICTLKNLIYFQHCCT